MNEELPNEHITTIRTMEELQTLIWQHISDDMIADLPPTADQSGIIETIHE